MEIHNNSGTEAIGSRESFVMKNDANLFAHIDIVRYVSFSFIASLCLLGRASGVLGSESQAIAGINRLNRQSPFIDDADRLRRSLNELLSY